MYSLLFPPSLNRTLIITNDIPRLEWKLCEQILTHSAAEQYSNLGEQAYFAYTHWQIFKCKGNITANLTCKKKAWETRERDRRRGKLSERIRQKKSGKHRRETRKRSLLILIWQRRSFIETDSLFCLASHTSPSISPSFALHLSPSFSFHPSFALLLA